MATAAPSGDARESHRRCTPAAWRSGRAVLILGPAGSGKSALALQLMALGAALSPTTAPCCAACRRLWPARPTRIRGMIEARGMGILPPPRLPAAERRAGRRPRPTETERLPPPRRLDRAGPGADLLHKIESPPFPRRSCNIYVWAARAAT
jgi:HPr kinase/phosphorylase